MTLVTAEELARGLLIATFGGAAGLCTIAMPGSALWLLPAGLAACGCALTVSEVRAEAGRLLAAPALDPVRGYLADAAAEGRGLLWRLPGVRPAEDAPALADALAPAEAAPAAPAGHQPPAAPKGALRPRQWLELVNDRPDDNPHLTVVGPSGCGKTTFVSAALGQRPGRVVVLTPKVTPGAWRGAEVVTLGDDLSYAPLAEALDALQTEAKRRSLALRRGEPLEPLTVVLDELPELHAEIPGAGKFAVRLSRWGRELGMRQVVIATSDDALNIPGWAATRSNYARVELRKPAPDGSRGATLDDGERRQPLDLGQLQTGAARAQLRPWRGESATGTTQLIRRAAAPLPVSSARPAAFPAPDAAPADLLAALLAEGVPSHQDAEGTGVTPVPGNRSNEHSLTVEGGAGGDVTINVAQIHQAGPPRRQAENDAYTQALIALYRAAGASGQTFAKTYAQHKGTKEIVFTAWQEGRDGKGPA